ncbi:MAG: hypothetical protein M3Q08_09805 [Pseudomonadota bacterium]|nr:hypothetical protein [Pseudomonadota bacterium]
MIFPARLHHRVVNGVDKHGVRDGDTAWFELQGPTLQGVEHLFVIKGRFAGLDAGKKGTPIGDEADAFVRNWLNVAASISTDPEWPLTIETHGPDKYGREEVTIRNTEDRCLNLMLIAAGLAVAWDGQGAHPL